MDLAPVYIVDIIKDVVDKVDAVLFPTLLVHINFTYGPGLHISKLMKDLTDAGSTTKYPLIALVMPFNEVKGGSYYADVTFPEIGIATLTNSTDQTSVRYGQTFKPVLYPIYYEFLTQLARHPSYVGSADPDSISHTKRDVPGTQPAITDIKDFLDAIVLSNVRITIKQFCSS